MHQMAGSAVTWSHAMSEHPNHRLTSSMSPDPMVRSCGTCRVCCKLPNIPELNKPLDTWCTHVNRERASERGCSVFGTAQRPSVCSAFSCGWALGMGDAEDRPDRLGVLIQPTVRADTERVLTFVEFRPGALAEPRAQALLEQWAAKNGGFVIIRKHATPTFMQVPITINRITVVEGIRERILPARAASISG